MGVWVFLMRNFCMLRGLAKYMLLFILVRFLSLTSPNTGRLWTRDIFLFQISHRRVVTEYYTGQSFPKLLVGVDSH